MAPIASICRARKRKENHRCLGQCPRKEKVVELGLVNSAPLMGRSSGGGERGSEKKAVVESQEERGGDRTAQFTPDDLIASQHEMEKGREGGGKSNRGTGGFRSILKRTI